MEKKVCTTCKIEKKFIEFNKYPNRSLEDVCKVCEKKRGKIWVDANKEKIKKYKKEYYLKNKARLLSLNKINKNNNKERNSKLSKEWRKNNPNRVSSFRKKWRSIPENKEKELKGQYKRNKEKYKNDPFFNLKTRLRARTRFAFTVNKWNKQNTTANILGADYKTVFKHLESKFTDGMSWDNRSEWHIDHIIPLALAKTEEELIKLCHYTNLQPLWAKENIRKGKKLDYIIKPRKP